MLKTYSEFRPTPFDSRGLALDDRQDWLEGPVSQNRDSDVLTRSNWIVVLGDFCRIDPEGNDHEIHRFGHWACGWLEIVLCRPDSECAGLAEEWQGTLENYPVACDEHYSQLENDETEAYWASMSVKHRMETIESYNERYASGAYSGRAVSIFAARRDYTPDEDTGTFWEYLTRD